MHTPDISIVVGYRNRDIARVNRSLDSLENQNFKNFELIFVDYGSEVEIAPSTKNLIESYSFARYIYTETRGLFWSRAHALNTGFKFATGRIVLIYDIDLIIEPDFLLKITKQNYIASFYTFSCFYLPEHFDLVKQNIFNDGIHYEQNYVGLCAVLREDVLSINGFDEFYMVWGAEDDGFYNSLTLKGIKRYQVSVDEFTVFHQWHPTHSPGKPSLWYLCMVNHLFLANKSTNNNWGQVLTSRDRPVLRLTQSNDYKNKKKVKFSDNRLLFFNPIIAQFHKLTSGEVAWIEYQHFDEPNKQNISLFKSFVKFKKNKDLVDKKELYNDILNFFYFFIGSNKNLLADYYFEQTDGKSILFICQKK